MQLIKYPKRDVWKSLCQRPSLDSFKLEKDVRQIMDAVKSDGDKALKEFSKKFDAVTPKFFVVSKSEFSKAEKKVNAQLKKAIELAKHNIERFHSAQSEKIKRITTTSGVVCWRKSIPIERVGLYIPGGTAPRFSTLLMLGIPSKLAGCKEIIVCTPPRKNGTIAPEILYTAKIIGINKIYKLGGAQAIAAMTFGTKTIPSVYKIFGPGNQYVTMAKMIAQQQGVAIDMPAGPSEILVIADKSCNPDFVASDLLSQAEHGADSQVVLVSDNLAKVQNVLSELERQLEKLPRRQIAKSTLQNSTAILVNNLQEAIAFSNTYAPEHLIIATKNANDLAEQVTNAGSVFLGNYSCESAGDYASGTNHTLPTNGYARGYSGVSLDSFVKKITFQELTSEGIQNIGSAIELMADAENLQGHKNAVTLRLNSIGKPLINQLADQPINLLARQNIVNARPYSSARDEFSGNNKIYLDANENPFNTGYNRYPDPRQSTLKEKISKLKKIPVENIFLGNGSDEAIDLIIRAFCIPGEDKIAICPPTYGMYQVAAYINDIEVIKVPLTTEFQLDSKKLSEAINQPEVKLVFLCSPNNPTGNLLRKIDIINILNNFNGIVVLDEAYIDFSSDASLQPDLSAFPNFIILQTFSKAWGLAGIRLGMAFGHKNVISILDKIKPPYNISELTQQLALKQLDNIARKNEVVTILNEQKKLLIKNLSSAKNVLKVFPSAANFLLVKFKKPKKTYKFLLDKGIVVRDRSSAVEGCLRITVGTSDENKKLIELLNRHS